jgi:bifunctional DNA-binding transcriptional regulator/antitoxin component of YhaV-PrlF toxin-antitoxin module
MPTTTGHYTAVVTPRGRIKLPRELLRRHHWTPDTDLVFEETPEGVVLRAAKPSDEPREP